MPSKKKIAEWRTAGREFAGDRICDLKGKVPRSIVWDIEGCMTDLMGGNDEAAGYALEGARERIKEHDKGFEEVTT